MTDTFRALCAELLQGLDENRHPEVRYPGHLRLVMDRARAALAAEPEPPADGNHVADVRKMVEPAEGELAELVTELKLMASDAAAASQTSDAHILTRAADLLERLTVPELEPVGPTNEELVTHYNRAVTSAIAIRVAVRNLINEDVDTATAAGLRAVLARWGTPNLAQVRSSLGDGHNHD